MALSRVHTWSAGEVLLASDLNAEFNSVLNNANSLISPFTANISGGGFQLNNIIIGASTPLAGSFTTLSATSLMDLSGASAGQIKFPSTQNASSNANTLDDYAENTWTPSIGGTATYTTQVGSYLKIGKLVFVQFKLTINSIGSGSATTISGLPFTVQNTSDYGSGVVTFFASIATSVVSLTVAPVNNTTTCVFNGLTAAAATASATVTVFQNSARVEGSFCYIAAN